MSTSTNLRHPAAQRIGELQGAVFGSFDSGLRRSPLEPYSPDLQSAAEKVLTARAAYESAAEDFGQVAVAVGGHLRTIDGTEDAALIAEITEQLDKAVGLAQAQAIIAQRRGQALRNAVSAYMGAADRLARNPGAILAQYRADITPRIERLNADYARAVDALAEAGDDLRHEILRLAALVKKSDPPAASRVVATTIHVADSHTVAGLRKGAESSRSVVVMSPWHEPRGAYDSQYHSVHSYDQHGRAVASVAAGDYAAP